MTDAIPFIDIAVILPPYMMKYFAMEFGYNHHIDQSGVCTDIVYMTHIYITHLTW